MITRYANARANSRRVREDEENAHGARRSESIAGGGFALGRLLVTPAAIEVLFEMRDVGKPYSVRAGAEFDDPMLLVMPFLRRHSTGDWGDIGADDAAANTRAVESGERIVSVYELGEGRRLWIITEADRSSMTVLLPDEY